MGRNKFPQVTQLENENSFQIESRSTFLSSEIDTKPLAEPTKPLRPVKVFTENENSKKEDLNKRVLTEEEQEEEEERKERIRMIKRNTRKMLVFSITNFGMLGLVLGYIFLGAILFQTLEQHTETQNCETGKGAEQDMIKEYTQLFFNYIYFNITTDPLADLADGNSTLDGPDVYNAQLDAYIYEIRDFVLLNQATYKYYGQDDCQELSMWQTQSAVLFAVTVVTSIGYGHVFPTTWQGQIVILCYATIGIPLFLITTAKISFMLADIFAFLYKYIILCPCTFAVIIKKRNERLKREAEEEEDDDESGGKMSQMSWDNFVQKEPKIVDEETDQEEEEEKTTKVPLIVILGFYAGFLILGSYIFHILEEWTLITGAYFAYVRYFISFV